MVVAEGIYQVDTLGTGFSTLPVYYRTTSGWRLRIWKPKKPSFHYLRILFQRHSPCIAFQVEFNFKYLRKIWIWYLNFDLCVTLSVHFKCYYGATVKLGKVMSENVEEDLHQFDIKLKFMTFRGTLLFINVQPIVLGLIRQDWVKTHMYTHFSQTYTDVHRCTHSFPSVHKCPQM